MNNFYTTCSVIKLEHMCTARDDVDGQRDGKAYGNVDGDKGDDGGEVLDKSRVGFCCCCCCSSFVSAFRMCRINYSDVSHDAEVFHGFRYRYTNRYRYRYYMK